ncbi:MAG TPA: 6-phosphofructokinase, partial [Fimbriimonadaceae bacterium]|nr:6-phosphofructokinase [Fimbriimonadaceae bacterium]
GGDVPGLNACIKAAVYHVTEAGGEMVGIRRGWGGLLNFNLDDPDSEKEWTIPLDRINTRTIDRFGGTFLHTSRTQPSRVRADSVPDFLRDPDHPSKDPNEILDFTPHILKVLARLKLDALVTIGGDDTLSYSHRLHQEGFPVVAIPKTMDNDVFGTDYCIGFSTAVTRSVDFITSLRTAAGSHERICIVELFGRNSGETSLISAYLAGVDRAIISEVHFDPERLSKMLMDDKKRNPSHYAIMTISEGAQMVGGKIIEYGQADAYGHRKLGGIGAIAGDAIKQLTHQNIIYQQVAYLMRSGEPDALDRMVAISYANLATDLVMKGVSGKMTALRNGRYTVVPVETIMEGTKRVDVDELYDSDNYRPKVQNMMDKPMFLY